MVAPETKPFCHKYEARELLKSLLKDPLILLSECLNLPEDDSSFLIYCANAIIFYRLGKNYFDSEESKEAFHYFTLSLRLFNCLSDSLKLRYINSIQDIYNHLGIIHCTKEQYKEGLPSLAKAEQLYELGHALKS